MSRLTVRLPDSLHHQLITQAKSEGVSLNQYLVYSLARQVAMGKYVVQPVPSEKITADAKAFEELLATAPKVTPEEIKQALDKRELVIPETELERESIEYLEQHLKQFSEM